MMAMTRKQLLKDLNGAEPFYARVTLYSALRAVVELHKPWETLPELENPLVWCEACEEDYPCSTIQAIEKALG